MASTGDAQALSSRVWTVPNVISMLRLALVPVFAWLILTEQDVAAVVVLIVAGASDWFDGVIARRFDQMSRLGQLLDPAADRLYILVTLIGLGSRGFVPWWLVAVIVGRDVLLTALLPALRRRGLAPLQVHVAGKAGTFALMYSFPLLLLAHLGGTLGYLSLVVGWAAALWGIALYWLSAGIYIRQGLEAGR
ncbi:MAG: CDP-alcohol phosphatidyltransferase family protein [Actinobacteria bacterium]|nr:CDP-alcohol phosphatidyltransferase family protein [Actinomycetota bacterium]